MLQYEELRLRLINHEKTLDDLSEALGLDKMKEEWWSEGLKDDVRIQWKVDQDRKEVAAVRMIYSDQKLDAVLCISLDYNKIFQPLTNILTQENGGIVADKNGTVLYNKTGLTNLEFDKSEKMDSMIQKISQSCAYTKTKSEENDWVFAVRNTGKGISKEELPKIFERFYKVDNFTQGAGLGLSICQTIVERLKGTISVTSEVGKGTRFTVRLPNYCE